VYIVIVFLSVILPILLLSSKLKRNIIIAQILTSGRLIDFVFSKDGIRVDPLKVKSILDLPPPNNLTQLKKIQGKVNFFLRFICNYNEITKRFMRLLQKDATFIWYETSQHSFDALKHALTNTPLLHPPNYAKEYILYLDASTSTIIKVLVQ